MRTDGPVERARNGVHRLLVLFPESQGPEAPEKGPRRRPKEGVIMSDERTPGRTGSYRCEHCGVSVFFPFAGGPHKLRCPSCRKSIALEVVHDGIRWRVKRSGHSP